MPFMEYLSNMKRKRTETKNTLFLLFHFLNFLSFFTLLPFLDEKMDLRRHSEILL